MSRAAGVMRRPWAEEPLKPFSLVQKAALAGEITIAYVRARWWLRRRPVEQAIIAARKGAQPAVPGIRVQDTFRVAFRLGRIVERALDRLPGDTRCLTRSLVLVHLLARRGIPTKLVIGVRPRPFEAHAWVEYEGEPLLSPTEYAAGRLAEI